MAGTTKLGGAGSRPETVLIVDDDESLRVMLATLLRSEGFNVEAFPSATSFLALPLPSGPCCILLDLCLPDMSGIDVQAMLRRRGCAVPIVFLTGHGDIPTTVKAMKNDAVDFLIKPVPRVKLLRIVETALAQHRAVVDRMATFSALTPREREVMTCVIAGMPNKAIAATLGIAEKTVKIHRSRVMTKTAANSLADLVRLCGGAGIEPRP